MRSVTPQLARVNVKVPSTRSRVVAAAQGRALFELLAALGGVEQADQTGVSPVEWAARSGSRRRGNRSYDRQTPSAHPGIRVCRTHTRLTCANALLRGFCSRTRTLEGAL